MEQEQDIEEYQALTSCLSLFYQYGNWARRTVLQPKNEKWNSLSTQDQLLVSWYPKYLDDLNENITLNELFLQQMAIEIAVDWGVTPDVTQWYRCTIQDLDKVRSTLKQLVREWSIEGKSERKMSFDRIVRECDLHFKGNRADVNVLVTGCGLGRLVMDFVDHGYTCQGNEFSFHMLLMSSYILNHVDRADKFQIAPFIHKISHQISRDNILRRISIPDYCPLNIFRDPLENKGELMSMCAGSFMDLYGPLNLMNSETYTNDDKLRDFRNSNESQFDVVVTCFFLDTAHNIIDYLKTIHHCLKTTGLWINFGPLLWHFEDDDSTMQIGSKAVPMNGLELTREDLHDLCEKMGFTFEKYENNIPTTYGGDIHSLGDYLYKCEYWVCRKTGRV